MSAGDYHLLDRLRQNKCVYPNCEKCDHPKSGQFTIPAEYIKTHSLFKELYFTEEYLADDKLGHYVYERIMEQGY
jgi:hypothetical protein